MSSSAIEAENVKPVTCLWTTDALARLRLDDSNLAPIITADDAQPMSPHLDVWDAWPLANATGRPVAWGNGELWFALATARADDPEQRHHLARIHHFHRVGDRFEHLGQTLPEGHSPGAREWSGSARLEDGMVTLYLHCHGEQGRYIAQLTISGCS